MAVYPNGRLTLNNPGRYFGVAPGLDVYSRSRGDRLNAFVNDARDKSTGGVPTGYGLTGTVPPIKSGGLSSNIEQHIVVSATASGIMGVLIYGETSFAIIEAEVALLPLDDTSPLRTGSTSFEVQIASADRMPLDTSNKVRTASSGFALSCSSVSLLPEITDSPLREGVSSLSIQIADALGELKASADAIVSFEVSSNNPLLTASRSGQGEASFSLSFLPPILGAEANLSASSSVAFGVTSPTFRPLNSTIPTLSASSVIDIRGVCSSRLPLNDSPPARTASALFQLYGVLIPYAVGQMLGSTENTEGITPKMVADAVWSVMTVDANASGTMGRKLNDVSGGVSGGGLTEEQNAAILGAHQEAKLARQMAGNKAFIASLEDGSKVISIYGDDGVTVVRSLSISSDGSVRELA